MRPSKQIIAAALGALLLATPLAASALTGDRSVTFDTALAPYYYGAGEYEGVLHLTFVKDGTITGYYRDADSAAVRTVTGGLDGHHIWLDLGNRGYSTIEGDYNGRTIVGYTYVDGQSFTFEATPEGTKATPIRRY